MKSKRGWVTLSLLLITVFIVAGVSLLYAGNVIGAFLLIGAAYWAKDLAKLAVASKAREVRRAAYAESGVWRKPGVGAVSSAAAGMVAITVPNDRYFSDVFEDSPVVNPATGLSMLGGAAGIDMAGHLYGHTESLASFGGGAFDAGAGADAWGGTADFDT
jgi:hypothetical protein